MRQPTRTLPAFVLLAVMTACGGSGSPERPLPGEVWQGMALAYSGYRAGQDPDGGPDPTPGQIAEDLHILARNWGLIRVYSSGRHGRDVLEVIRRENLDLRVMLGIWLGREPGNEETNAREIEAGIRLANEYDDIVIAVNVGNEVLIEWTEHPVPERQVIRYVRRVKAAVSQPVTVADNYVWWRDHGAALAREVDFITMHSYPLWERKDIDEGLSYTIANYEQVRSAHPGKPIVIGEAGWATYTEGNLHVPRGGDERKQQRYHDEVTRWSLESGIPVFFFEAFDEPWKGPGTEGHWGLFTADRKAKPAVLGLFPDLAPDGPTSPSYPDRIVASGPDLAVVLRPKLAASIPGGHVNPMGPGLIAAEVVPIDPSGNDTALRLSFSGDAWAGLYLFLDDYDARTATHLAMRLKLPPAVARLELKLEGPADVSQSVELMDHAVASGGDGWTSFSVPLSDFEAIDLSRLAIVGLWNPSDRTGTAVSGDLIVDDLHFE